VRKPSRKKKEPELVKPRLGELDEGKTRKACRNKGKGRKNILKGKVKGINEIE